ncbi:MAG: ATP-binding protein [Actinomycetota bacterium]
MSAPVDSGPGRSVPEVIRRARLGIPVAGFAGAIVTIGVALVLAPDYDVVPDGLFEAHHLTAWEPAFSAMLAGLAVYTILREYSAHRVAARLAEEHRVASHLAELDQMRGDAVASVTHELKTPLTSLLGYAIILRKRAADLSAQQRDEYIAVMQEQAERILRLIEELLQSSRLESGKSRLRRAPLDLAAVAGRVATELAAARDREILVETPSHDLGLYGDEAAMEHVVTNLVDNALKYSSGTVRIGLFEGDGEVLLTVADEGEGIDPEELPHIFERFQQASNARGRASVGLGLYIVRNLVSAHGGRVWADSKRGKGTTFTIALPRRRDGRG